MLRIYEIMFKTKFSRYFQCPQWYLIFLIMSKHKVHPLSLSPPPTVLASCSLSTYQPVLLFLVDLHQFLYQQVSFLQLFRTSFDIIWKKIFVRIFLNNTQFTLNLATGPEHNTNSQYLLHPAPKEYSLLIHVFGWLAMWFIPYWYSYFFFCFCSKLKSFSWHSAAFSALPHL